MPRLAATVVTPWERDAIVVRLTKEIERLHASAARTVAEAVLQVGRRMQRIRKRLDHGEWERWVDEATPWTARTVRNYLALTQWASERPAEFEQFRHLGASKLYQLAAAPRPVLAQLKARKKHAVPDRDKPRTLELMTNVELGRVIGDLTGREPPPPVAEVSIKVVVGACARGVDKLQDATAVLVQRRDEVDADEVVEIHTALVEMTRTLGRAFRL